MQTDIYYGDITKTESLETYLMEKVEGATGEFLKNDSGAKLTVRVEQDRRRSQNRKPSYLCEILVKPSYSKRVIKIQKRDENFKVCVAKTVAALKVVLSKQASRKVTRRRMDPVLTQQPIPRFEDWDKF